MLPIETSTRSLCLGIVLAKVRPATAKTVPASLSMGRCGCSSASCRNLSWLAGSETSQARALRRAITRRTVM